jgi:CTP-dependent riboflavin kinase
MSIQDLEEIVNQGGERFGELLGKMNAYNANINGSNAYLTDPERTWKL